MSTTNLNLAGYLEPTRESVSDANLQQEQQIHEYEQHFCKDTRVKDVEICKSN